MVVVTGASRGLGRATVDEFAADGWDVIALVRSQSELSPYKYAAVQIAEHDMRDDASNGLLSLIGRRPVDVLVNNAAQGAAQAEIGHVDPQGLLESVDVNVAGPLRLVQALLPNLESAPAPVIVNITSRLGSMSRQASGQYADLTTSYAYRISKAGQNMLTISLANDLRGRVRCWAVHPGRLATDMGRPGASKLPATAASQLRELVESSDMISPRFCSLGEPDLEW